MLLLAFALSYLAMLALSMAMSRHHKALFTVAASPARQRLLRARELLQHSALPLGEIALTCGFASASHFSNRFRQAFGAAPGLLRAARQS